MKDRKAIEQELQNLINQYGLNKKLTVNKIKKMVWQEKGASAMEAVNKYEKKCLSYFSGLERIDDLNKILQVFIDAWNYFPHQSLGGRSPEEVVKEETKKQPETFTNKAMPKVIVGGQEMEWEQYEAMLKEMEKQQEPFKRWVETEVMPKYQKYLETTLAKRTREKHFEVADIFFERVWYVGFINFCDIRKEFIQKEFPRWWQTHVLMSSLKEKEIVSSLQKLFEFIEFSFNEDIKKFGF